MSLSTETRQEDAAASIPLPGKDEMNFAEFPIALLTDRVPKGQKSIKYEDQIYDTRRRKLITSRRIIEGSEEYGLPTATDDAVVLALIQLTKQKSNFNRRVVEFTRLELIRMLGWNNEGKSYDRIKLSLQRIANVTYNYDNAWWDNRQQTWTTKIFHIIETVEINDSRSIDQQGGLFPSRIVWNEVVFDSFQANFVRDLDFQLCMQLKHPTSLRMYRFLGKRFYYEPDLTFDLKEFGSRHVGLGGKYEGGTQLARKLKPAIEELERAGFLEPLEENERFLKNGRDWSIRLSQKRPDASGAPALPHVDEPQKAETQLDVTAELVKRGITAAKAIKLVKEHPTSILGKLEVFDWLRETKDKRIGKSPAGYLVKSIEEDYTVPPDFMGKADRRRLEENRKAKEAAFAEKRTLERKQEAHDRAMRQTVDAYLKQRTPGERSILETDALAQADAEDIAGYNDPAMAMFRDTLRLTMVRKQVQKLLAAMPLTAAKT
jgi:hypothetical protein